MKQSLLVGILFGVSLVSGASAKEIAFSYDDAPFWSTVNGYETVARTEKLIAKMKEFRIPGAMIFANACKRPETKEVLAQLKKYVDAGHIIANHTCSHPRLDLVGYAKYSEDVAKGDFLLSPLFPKQKYFRFPYLNEGSNEKVRDKMRDWLKKNNYRNGHVSVDDADYAFSDRVTKARSMGKKIDMKRVGEFFVRHVAGAADFYDDLAVKTLGRSPKHVLLLHERDMTVEFIGELATELRKRGWKIISAEEAYKDPIYLEQPKNISSGGGLISQIAFERTGHKSVYTNAAGIQPELNEILGLTADDK